MPLERIVIVGGGIAAWLAAAALARTSLAKVHVLEDSAIDDSLGLPLPIEATLPATAELLARLGLDEDALLGASRGCFTLGRALSGWAGTGTGFHPYGEIGAPIGPTAFHHLAARLRSDGTAVRLTNYALAALAAQAGRFALPGAKAESVLSTLGYGAQFETAQMRQALRADALSRGVSTQPGRVADLELDFAGLIAALVLDDGMQVSGDFFVDCSGPGAAAIGKMPGARFAGWSQWLPCDTMLAELIDDQAPPLPYTHAEAHGAGWRMASACQGGIGAAVVCAGNLVDSFEREPYRSAQGRQAAPWLGNCLAIGGAATVLDPVATSQLHLAASAIARLIALLPTGRECPVEAAEYNRQICDELDNARDFAIAHYKLNGRSGEALWDHCRAMPVPDRLEHRIALYGGIGRIALFDEETFEASDWIALFDALGLVPRSYDAMAGALPLEQISDHLARMRGVMLQALAQMPSHAEFLRTHLPALAGPVR